MATNSTPTGSCPKCKDLVNGEHTPCECHLLGGVPNHNECHSPSSTTPEWKTRLKHTLPKDFTGTDIELILQQFIEEELAAAEEREKESAIEAYETGLGEGYKKGRADALAEALEKVKTLLLDENFTGHWKAGFYGCRTAAIDAIKKLSR